MEGSIIGCLRTKGIRFFLTITWPHSRRDALLGRRAAELGTSLTSASWVWATKSIRTADRPGDVSQIKAALRSAADIFDESVPLSLSPRFRSGPIGEAHEDSVQLVGNQSGRPTPRQHRRASPLRGGSSAA